MRSPSKWSDYANIVPGSPLRRALFHWKPNQHIGRPKPVLLLTLSPTLQQYADEGERMKPVGMMDAGFLLGERRNQPMHVGALMLMSPNADRAFIERAKNSALQYTTAQPPFSQKLVRKAGIWFWAEDAEFDIESHFHHMSLPEPGQIRDLLALVSKLHSNLLDRTKPLWEVYLIEGLNDGRVALYVKVHHALVDGIAAMRMLVKATADDPSADVIPLWALPINQKSDRAPVKLSPFSAMMQATQLARSNLGSVPKVLAEVYKSIRAGQTDPDHVSVFQAPKCLFNQRISGSRRFAAQSWSLDRIRVAGKQHGVTLNDTVLAMCASALRRYLLDRDALPNKALVAMVPISLRKDDSMGGNQVAMALANLATHLPDPLERLDRITRSMNNSKQRFSRMSQGEILAYLGVVMSIHGGNIALGLNPSWQAFNIVISNVPGPKKVRYWNRARVDGVYPVSIAIDGAALNITLNSYANNLEFGLIGCRRTLPHMQDLLQYLEDGLVELEQHQHPRTQS